MNAFTIVKVEHYNIENTFISIKSINNMHSQEKNCPICKKKVIGRTDKIFCSIRCKSKHHNNIKVKTDPIVLKVNSILHKNYKILSSFLDQENDFKVLHKSILTNLHFEFKYFTSLVKSSHNHRYIVYNISYTYINNDLIVIKYKPDL